MIQVNRQGRDAAEALLARLFSARRQAAMRSTAGEALLGGVGDPSSRRRRLKSLTLSVSETLSHRRPPHPSSAPSLCGQKTDRRDATRPWGDYERFNARNRNLLLNR